MMNKTLLLLLSLTLVSSLQAQSLRILTESDPPYNYLDKSGKLAGFALEDMKADGTMEKLTAEWLPEKKVPQGPKDTVL